MDIALGSGSFYLPVELVLVIIQAHPSVYATIRSLRKETKSVIDSKFPRLRAIQFYVNRTTSVSRDERGREVTTKYVFPNGNTNGIERAIITDSYTGYWMERETFYLDGAKLFSCFKDKYQQTRTVNAISIEIDEVIIQCHLGILDSRNEFNFVMRYRDPTQRFYHLTFWDHLLGLKEVECPNGYILMISDCHFEHSVWVHYHKSFVFDVSAGKIPVSFFRALVQEYNQRNPDFVDVCKDLSENLQQKLNELQWKMKTKAEITARAY